MAKKFTIKKKRLRARAEVRRFKLKTNPQPKGVKPSQAQKNEELIRSLEARVKGLSVAAPVKAAVAVAVEEEE